MIASATVNLIIETARIEDVVGDVVALKRRGSNLIGLCPFHNERTPSFTVSPAKGIYKCFGCGKAGNAVNFLMDLEGLTYPQALKHLAHRYQIPIDEERKSQEQVASEQLSQSIAVINKYAQEYYQSNLFETDTGRSIGLTYFRERGLTENTIKRFQLGFAPDEYDAFYKNATDSGYLPEILLKSALVLQNEKGKRYDFLRNRIVFPIHNVTGKVVGFAGRLMSTQKTAAKYINSAETDLYQKSKILYGYHLSRDSIRRLDECLLVEGYMDVITMHQAGFENVVASSGTSLTPDQVRMIKRFTNNLTFLYDGDNAGLKAALRGLDIALEEGMNVQVCVIPGGEDPDSFLRKSGASAMTDLLSGASGQKHNILNFQVDLLMKEAGNDPMRRADVVSKMISSLALIKDHVRRNILVRELSQRMKVDEAAVVSRLNEYVAKGLAKQGGVGETGLQDLTKYAAPEKTSSRQAMGADSGLLLERDIIRLLVKYGGQNYVGDQTAAAYIIQTLEDVDFADPVCARIFERFKVGLSRDEIPSYHELLLQDDKEVNELITDLMEVKYQISPNWEDKHDILTVTSEMIFHKDIDNVMKNFALYHIEKCIVENNEELKDAEQAKDKDKIDECLITRMRLNQMKKEYAAKSGTTILAIRVRN